MELGHDRSLGTIVHGGVAAVPVAQHPQPLELRLLRLDPLGGVGAARLAELGLGDLVLAPALGPESLLDLPLDRQAVAVPARHIVDVVAQGEARADDEILKDLVQRMPDVDGAVGVGRPVVEHVQGGALGLPRLPDALVQAGLGPAGEDLGFLLGEPRPHGEAGLGQEDSVAIVAAGLGVSGLVVGHEGAPGEHRERRRSRRERVGVSRPASSRRAANSQTGKADRAHARAV